MHRPHCLTLLLIFVLGLGSVHAQTPTWTKTTPADVVAAGIGVQLTGADYGNSTFVLAGYFGGTAAVPAFTPAVYTSPDGVTWTRRTLPATGMSTGKPRFLNGKFYLGLTPSSGGSGIIVSSADGVTWTSSGVINSALNAPNEFVFGNGVYLAPVSGGSTQIITSTDGVTWTPRTINSTRSSHVTFFSGKFYASVYPSAIGLYSSTDGVTWAPVTAAPAGPGVLAAGPSILLTTTFGNNVSGQAVSTDGAAFTTSTPGIVMQSETIRYLNGAFVTQTTTVANSNDLNLARASKDGQTWTTLASTANVSDAAEVAFGNGTYLYVGEFNTFTGTATGGASGGGSTTPAPTVSAQPAASQSASLGGSVTFTFTITGTGISFQWFFNGVAIAGATSGTYTIGNVTLANAGTYTATATNAGGTVTSNAAVLAIGTATNAAHLSNVSIRSNAGSDAQTLIVGVTVGGAGTSGTKTILVRGSGPALATLGVTGQLADPVLTGYAGTTQIFANDDWNNDAQVLAQGAALGAFPLPASSKDAALVGTIPAGGYSVQLTGKAGATGVALVEVYDATTSYTTATPRLINVSARTQVGTGANILITGFVVAGSGTKQLLIRASGPGLIQLGVTSTLVDPKLELYNSSGVKVAENDNWDSSTASAQTSVGAFPLAAGSKDSVLVANLAPGAYTAQVSGIGSTTGVALVEIYELP